MVLTFTRRSLTIFLMALAMLWAASISTSAWSGEQIGGYHPPICTEGCLQSITWE